MNGQEKIARNLCEQWFTSWSRLKRDVPEHCRSLVVKCEEASVEDAAAWETRTPELMALLTATAPQLRSLEFHYPSNAPPNPLSALPADVGQLNQLSALRLSCGEAPITTEQVGAMLEGLPALQHFTLEGDPSVLLLEGIPVNIFTRCCKLEVLSIRGAQLRAVPSELGRLTALTRLQLPGHGAASLPDSISLLSALQELQIPVHLASVLPSGLAACLQLTKLEMGLVSASPVLSRLHSLRLLSVLSLPLEQPHAPYWTHLTALSELQLHMRGEIPAGRGGMTGLRSLTITGATLNELPAGPYLSRLHVLSMGLCIFQSGVPRKLAAATQLRTLTLPNNSGINLSTADVAVLSSLPALTGLGLMDLPADANQRQWKRGKAKLKAAHAAKGCKVLLIYVGRKVDGIFRGSQRDGVAAPYLCFQSHEFGPGGSARKGGYPVRLCCDDDTFR